MSDLKTILSLIRPDIEKIDSAMHRDIDELASVMDQKLFEILRFGLFSGGKRFRPLLAVISARLCGCGAGEVYRLAIAFEYLHMATLFHDDVIDGADLRRGKPTIIKAYGIAAAILAGDFLHARSMELVGELGGKKALEKFCRATRAMVDGEFIQLRNVSNYNQSERDYFRAIEGKTAVLISAATEIGALVAGANNLQLQALKEYGRNLGYGFQIIDDLLDYMGDESVTGKTIGNDLAEGKMTLPLIYAMERAESHRNDQIMTILSIPELRRKSFDEVYAFIAEHDGFQQARIRACACIDKALSHLGVFREKQSDDIKILQGLAEYALGRKK